MMRMLLSAAFRLSNRMDNTLSELALRQSSNNNDRHKGQDPNRQKLLIHLAMFDHKHFRLQAAFGLHQGLNTSDPSETHQMS